MFKNITKRIRFRVGKSIARRLLGSLVRADSVALEPLSRFQRKQLYFYRLTGLDWAKECKARLRDSKTVHISKSCEFLEKEISKSRTNFSLPIKSLQWIWTLLLERRPSTIFEFGSGISTLLFGAYAQMMDREFAHPVSVYSLDQDEDWLCLSKSSLRQLELEDYVEVSVAPVDNFTFLGLEFRGLSISDTNWSDSLARSKIDFVLIDGPTANVGRGGTLPLVYDFLSPGCLILLDDYFRSSEQQICRDWVTMGLVHQMDVAYLPHGLCLLRKKT